MAAPEGTTLVRLCGSWPRLVGGLWREVNYTVTRLMQRKCGRICRGPLRAGPYNNNGRNGRGTTVLFADDTSLFHAHTDFDTLIKEINEELQKITTWFHTNKLSLNIKKSNFIMFLPKGKKYNTDNVKININGNEIKQVNFTKFVGIYIDEHLSWAQHIEFLSKKFHEM